MRRGLALLALAGALAACSFRTLVEESPLVGGEMSVEKEMEFTAQIHAQIRDQAPLVSDPIVLDFIYTLGQEIVAVTEPQPFVYRFSLIDDDTLNAFTIGGGYVYLNTEVVAQAGDVGELAGVLAHEIAHVRERHVARRSEGQGLATLITMATVAAVALGGGDPTLLAIGQGLNVSLQIQNTREAEREADRAGIEFMVRSGYDPHGMTRFFQRIIAASPKDGAEIPAYLFTHPALEDRIASAAVDIERSEAPANLQRHDARLAQIQKRLATISSTVAGGSGLFARASFDRTLSDPLLEQAERARQDAAFGHAAELLRRAVADAPGDPRVAIAQAEVAEEIGDLQTARSHWERAFEIDPTVPMVQYRLGLMHARLGNRSRAAFFLERAADGFRQGSSARKRAEFEIRRVSFPVFVASSLQDIEDTQTSASFVRGTPLIWRGNVSRGFMDQNPEFTVSWRDPSGVVVHEEIVRMSPGGRVSSRLDTAGLPAGRWILRVNVESSLIEERRFDLVDPRQS